jgi:single-strand DNA-binding protein
MSIPVTVKGNLGSDPELKFIKTSRGETGLVTFSLAHTPRERKGEEWVEGETLWFRVTQWGEKGEALVDALRKGDTVIVQGNLKQSTFKGRDGQDKTALEINAADIGLVPKVNRNSISRNQSAPSRSEAPGW